MSPDAFQKNMATHLANIKLLANSQEASEMLKWNWKSKEDDNLVLAQKLIDKATALHVPPHLWFISGHRNHRDTPLLPQLFSRTNFQKAIKALLAFGVSPWPYFYDDKGVHFCKADTLARQVFPHGGYDIVISSRKHALQAGLTHLSNIPDGLALDFLKALLTHYEKATFKSSATSVGIMGSSDKNAKTSANLIVSFESQLREAFETYAKDFTEKLDVVLKDAKLRLESKTKKNDEAFDPEKLKKKLTADQKDRLRTLLLLAENCTTDTEALQSVLDQSDWILAQPQALCINQKSSGSFARVAILNSSIAGVQALDTLGSNVWLAAAQAGQGNAPLWVAELLSGYYRHDKERSERQDVIYPLLSRLIAYGAFLDGSADPIGHATAKTDEAITIAKVKNYNAAVVEQHLIRLRAGIESLALKELLEGRFNVPTSSKRSITTEHDNESNESGESGEGDGSQAGSADSSNFQEEAPRRKSSRL